MNRLRNCNRVKVGEIGVDAGLCWIGDPCYILHKEGPQSKDLGSNWQEFCDTLTEGCEGHNCLDYKEYRDGVVVSTGYGDGSYPVYADFEDGRIARVTVEFIEKDEDYD